MSKKSATKLRASARSGSCGPTDAVPTADDVADSSGAPDTFDDKVARPGQVVRVVKGVSIINARAGIGIDIVCTEGVCGTWIVDVVERTPT